MQPSRRAKRHITGALRPDQPLRYDRLSDPILVRRAKDGDMHALEALCARHQPRVERTARHLLRDPEDALDATQDTLARVCAKLGQFRGEAAFTTWLHRLTINACRDLAQKRLSRPTVPLVEDMRACSEVGPARRAELAELRAELREGLATIPDDQARVLVLKDGLGLSFEEISAASGMPVGTAKCYAHRGRAGMRAVLEEAVP
ncbi:MAG: sigma-70 family RNA polymerase sigma factor [Gaiellales bacterium]